MNPTDTIQIVTTEGDTASATTTTAAGATTMRRTRSRGTIPVPAPAHSTSTPVPVLATISEGAAQPNEAGPSSSNATRQPRRKPPTRLPNPLDTALPSFSSRQSQDHQDGTAGLEQITGPLLESSQPPPAFSQLSSSFGSASLGTPFGAAALNTSFGGAASTTLRRPGINAVATPLSPISALSSPTASGNFKDVSTTVPNTRITTPAANNTTTLPNTLNASRDSRAALISDEESEDEEDARLNQLHGNRKPRKGDRPRLVPVDKEMEYYQEVHAGGSNASANGNLAHPFRFPEPLKLQGRNLEMSSQDGRGGESQAAGVPSDGSRPRFSGTGGTARHGGAARRGGRSQKLTRTSGPTLANLMGLPGIETRVSYGVAAVSSHAAHPREAGTLAGYREAEPPRGRADRAAGRNTSRGQGLGHGEAGELSRGRDVGGLGPHRSSRRRPSPVGMSAHPYAFTNLTPTTNATSSRNTNADTNADGTFPGNNGASLDGEPGPATQVWRRGLGVLKDIDDDNDDDDVPSRANRSPRRVHPHRRRDSHGAVDDDHSNADSIVSGSNGPPGDEVTDDEEVSRWMAAARRKEKLRREAAERRLQRLSENALGKFLYLFPSIYLLLFCPQIFRLQTDALPARTRHPSQLAQARLFGRG